MEKDKINTDEPGMLELFIRRHAQFVNRHFNALPLKHRQWALIGGGLIVATVALTEMIQSFIKPPSTRLNTGQITIPKDIYNHLHMKNDTSETLIPIGKMKGEMDGEFDAFYLAMDKNGQLFTNRQPSYAQDRYLKSNGWESITNEQFRAFEKQLHFIPHGSKSLRP